MESYVNFLFLEKLHSTGDNPHKTTDGEEHLSVVQASKALPQNPDFREHVYPFINPKLYHI